VTPAAPLRAAAPPSRSLLAFCWPSPARGCGFGAFAGLPAEQSPSLGAEPPPCTAALPAPARSSPPLPSQDSSAAGSARSSQLSSLSFALLLLPTQRLGLRAGFAGGGEREQKRAGVISNRLLEALLSAGWRGDNHRGAAGTEPGRAPGCAVRGGRCPRPKPPWLARGARRELRRDFLQGQVVIGQGVMASSRKRGDWGQL